MQSARAKELDKKAQENIQKTKKDAFDTYGGNDISELMYQDSEDES